MGDHRTHRAAAYNEIRFADIYFARTVRVNYDDDDDDGRWFFTLFFFCCCYYYIVLSLLLLLLQSLLLSSLYSDRMQARDNGRLRAVCTPIRRW